MTPVLRPAIPARLTGAYRLTASHVFILALSNILVQYPFTLLGFHTTWGAFTYPATFILTDLTVRLTSSTLARRIVLHALLPALVSSYMISAYLETGTLHLATFTTIHSVPLRIALASVCAYASGQWLDMLVFQRYRSRSSWWLAPTLSAIAGNTIDTLLFFCVAFYHSSNPFLSAHWPELAMVDLFFKVIISLAGFVPVYGYVLNRIGRIQPASGRKYAQ